MEHYGNVPLLPDKNGEPPVTMGDHRCFSKSNLTAGCVQGGALRPLGKGKEEEGTEPGLCDTGLFSADLVSVVETENTSVGSSKTSGSLGQAASPSRTVES